MIVSDSIFMQRALDLATLGRGTASPNPMVGCVIVHENRIIGEGWHRQYGGPHAEVNAINSVVDKSLLPGSRLFVTLEPCSHYGKTPPCADLLIDSNIRDVVICNTDPNPLVKGRGIRKLLDTGCRVQVGLLENEGWELNKYFFTYHTQKRPYILLKWAESADGFIGRTDNSKVWISSKLSKKLVHKWRSELQAIMVGTRTALVDDPKLNTREWTGQDPVRIILDLQLRLPDHLQIFDQTQPTLIYNLAKEETLENLQWVKLRDETDILAQFINDLYARNIQSVMVEGGTTLLNSFIWAGLWDEAYVFKCAKTIGEAGVQAPTLDLFHMKQMLPIGPDKLVIYKNQLPVTKY